MNPFQELAERLAEESIRRFGFVVVVYLDEDPPAIGIRTEFLWRSFRMPQPFIVARKATPEEWARQHQLYREVTKMKPHPSFLKGKPFVLVTD